VGTLEQLFMSPFGFGRVMIAKTVGNMVDTFLRGAITLAVMLVVSGRTLAVDPITVLPIAALAVAPAVGIGFLFGGLAIRFKRVENAFQLMQFGFIGLIAAPVAQYPWMKWLPLAQGSQLLQTAMRDGIALWNLPAGRTRRPDRHCRRLPRRRLRRAHVLPAVGAPRGRHGTLLTPVPRVGDSPLAHPAEPPVPPASRVASLPTPPQESPSGSPASKPL